MAPSIKYSKEECIDCLREAAFLADDNLTAPKYREIRKKENKQDCWPSTYPIRRTHWDNWVQALKAASLDEHAIGKGGKTEKSKQPSISGYSEEEWLDMSSTKRATRKQTSYRSRIKLEMGCKRCGYDEHPAALSFHHINPEEKEFMISQSRNYKKEKVKEELKKCYIICENCHRVETTPMNWLDI